MILETALMCMAFNIYHEANNQSMLGQIAVGQVVMNRVESTSFPNTVCEVVKQGQTYKNGKMVLHKCQFSWYCDGKSDDVNKRSKAWSRALDYASIVISGRVEIDLTQGSLWYHAYYVKPSWAKQKERVARIDSHIFYKKKRGKVVRMPLPKPKELD